MLISAIVITKNEAASIRRCLSSLQGVVQEVVVVDSLSTDGTDTIAREFTPHVHRRQWMGYSAQKEYAISLTTHEWILWIDADEEVSPGLRAEIAALSEVSVSAYRIPRKSRYLGRWILHGGWYPDRVVRLFRKSRSRLCGKTIHESVIVGGPVGDLIHPLHHYTYRSISYHIDKINAFTSLSAELKCTKNRKISWFSPLFHALGKFFSMYIIKRGFLDGVPGLHIATLGAFYVYIKYAKLWERIHLHPESTKANPT